MCYSAQIWSDFRKYQRLGGRLDIAAFVEMAGWTKDKGTWIKSVPAGLRRSLIDVTGREPFLGENGSDLFKAVAEAEAQAVYDLTAEVDRQEQRIAKANLVLASSRPTKAAQNELRVASKKRDDALRRIEAETHLSQSGDTDRIWPGHFAPVLIRHPETGERAIVPMRYRCRLPG